ncbi:hypothetical protein ASD39_22115 [Sphingomonas sp. Root50]|nr:hypothetical protein ASD17_18215 [Sphingomonas sp. Root1294]KQY70590.1 hypothetical protein ASD39_22115 [Sphingomonas sp. Root50]KRB91920.1 hypothetical protein ASE22_08195 [Sphingomonas sp. Root720]
MSYWRFAMMAGASTVLMDLNTYAWSHIAYSQTRLWMALMAPNGESQEKRLQSPDLGTDASDPSRGNGKILKIS